MKRITDISRILVGALFIVSGLIKANDPIGFSFKLEEYFAPDALNWSFFVGTEVTQSIIICVGEVLLGVAILAGEKFILSTWLLLLMIIGFTFLTGYTAIGNWFHENYDSATTHWWENLLGFKAREDIHYFKDCGCFGDALKLTPWQSFLKDVVLLVLIVWLFIKRKTVKAYDTVSEDLKIYIPALILIATFSLGVIKWAGPIWFTIIVMIAASAVKSWRSKEKDRGWAMAVAVALISFFFTFYCYKYLPIRDYRPFAEDIHLWDNIRIPKDAPTDSFVSYKYCFNLKTKQYESFTGNYPWDKPEEYRCDSFNTIQVRKGYEAPIHDFNIMDDAIDSNLTDEVLNYDGYQLLNVMYALKKSDKDLLNDIEILNKELIAQNIPFYNLTGSVYDDQQAIAPNLKFYSCDGTTLKTIIRSNPGLLLMKGDLVVKKWPASSYPDTEEVIRLIKDI